MLILGKRSAMERVVCFLQEMSARARTKGAIDLPMSRTDIADYLGLTIETISRSITALRNEGVVLVPNAHQLILRDMPSLRALAAEA